MNEETKLAVKLLHTLEIEMGAPVGSLEHNRAFVSALAEGLGAFLQAAEDDADEAYAEGYEKGYEDGEEAGPICNCCCDNCMKCDEE